MENYNYSEYTITDCGLPDPFRSKLLLLRNIEGATNILGSNASTTDCIIHRYDSSIFGYDS